MRLIDGTAGFLQSCGYAQLLIDNLLLYVKQAIVDIPKLLFS